MTRRFFIAAALAALSAAAVPAHASGPKTKAELIVLLGTQADGGGSIDPRIGDLPQLKTRPLSSYNTYRLLDRTTLDLERGQPATYSAPNGSTLAVKLKHVSDDHRYTIREEISGGILRRPVHVEFTSSANDTVFIGGLPYQDGAIFFGIKILP